MASPGQIVLFVACTGVRTAGWGTTNGFEDLWTKDSSLPCFCRKHACRCRKTKPDPAAGKRARGVPIVPLSLRGGSALDPAVHDFLRVAGLLDHSDDFAREGIRLHNLHELDDDDLQELGVSSSDAVARFHDEVQKRRAADGDPSPQQSARGITKSAAGRTKAGSSQRAKKKQKPPSETGEKTGENKAAKTRLQRLLLLLDGGTTAVARRTAAEQLGTLYRAHVQLRGSLVGALKPLMGSARWETRAACGLAVEEMAKSDWEEARGGEEAREEGEEGDWAESLGADLDGLSVEREVADDMLLYARSESVGEEWSGEREEDDDVGVVGARGKKRRARHEVVQGDTEQGAAKKKIVVQYKGDGEEEEKEKATMETAEDGWPLTVLCEESLAQMTHPEWERRHGAVLALKHIMRYHPMRSDTKSGQGTVGFGSSRAVVCAVVCRVLVLLCRDRFSDFSGDKLVSPVRETAAQVLGLAAMRMGWATLTAVLRVLQRMVAYEPEWEVRQSALLGLKYVVAFANVAQDADMVEELLVRGLKDDADDVRSVAADTCAVFFFPRSPSPLQEMASTLGSDKTRKRAELLEVLWQCLSACDELSSSTSSLLNLIARLVPDSRNSEAAGSVDEHRVRGLWRFFRHALASVRSATLHVVGKVLVTSSAPSEQSGLSHSTHWELMQLLFLNFMIEGREEVLEATEQIWNRTLEVVGPIDSWAATKHDVGRWLSAAASPLGAFVRPEQVCDVASVLELVAVPERAATNPKRAKKTKKRRGKGSEEEQEEEQQPVEAASSEFEVTSKTQDVVSRGIARLLFFCNKASPLELVSALVAMLKSRLPMHRRVSALALFEYTALRQSLSTSETSSGLAWSGHDAIAALQQVAQAGENSDDGEVGRAASAGCLLLASTMERSVSVNSTQLLRNVVAVVRLQPDSVLQRKAAGVLVRCAAAGVWDKATTNELCRGLCADPSSTPQLHGPLLVVPGSAAETKGERVDSITRQPASDSVVHDCGGPELRAARVCHRGSMLTMQMAARELGSDLFTKCVGLEACSVGGLSRFLLRAQRDGANLVETDRDRADFIAAAHTTLATLPLAVQSLGDDAFREAREASVRALRDSSHAVRHMASRLLGSLCASSPLPSMEALVRQVLPMLHETDDDDARRGAVEALCRVVEQTTEEATMGYAVFLVAPVLGRISDALPEVRAAATHCFSALLRTLPLEQGVPDPPGLSTDLAASKDEQRTFLAQLTGAAKVREYPVTAQVRAELRQYQVEGVNWMGFLVRYQLHGILCDDMGLGKTLQAIAVMATQVHNRRASFNASRHDRDRPLPSLVVCPTTLVAHWCNEVKKFAPTSLRAVSYAESTKEGRAGVLRALRGTDDVLVLSYERLRNDVEALLAPDDKEQEEERCASQPRRSSHGGRAWNFVVLDEGHIIKNPQSKTSQAVRRVGLRASHRLMLTGTPIQNNVLELWGLFDFLMPGLLGTAPQFNAWYSRPIIASGRDLRVDPDRLRRSTAGHRPGSGVGAGESVASARIVEEGEAALSRLHRLVLPFMLRRRKEQVLQDLPPKIIQDVVCPMSGIQRALYARGEAAKRRELAKSKSKSTSALQSLTFLRKVANHPLLVLDDPEVREDPDMGRMVAAAGDLHDIAVAPKLTALRDLLSTCGVGTDAEEGGGGGGGGHRVLVFAQMRSMLDLVERDLLQRCMPQVSYLRMDGDTPALKRFEMQEKFNADPTIEVLLLTTRVGGLGLTLTGADAVVFVEHDWNPMRDLQAMDRAHRIGQKRVVNVYRLIAEGSLEERIMSLQNFKLNVANTVVSDDNANLENMDTSSLLNLFQGSPDETNQGPKAKSKKPRSGADSQLKQTIADMEGGANGDELWGEEQYAEQFGLPELQGH